ncbi:MAG: hypothetical protein KDC12_03810 [Flavobacteriales bacterium]|nr:hypothetical protein [Flavobacteriales bacterium]
MTKHEDQFFEMFRESFDGFSPEVPGSVYAGVQKKLFWSSFMGFNWARLNIWYLLIASAALTAWGVSGSQGECRALSSSHDSNFPSEWRDAARSQVTSAADLGASIAEISRQERTAAVSTSSARTSHTANVNPEPAVATNNNPGETPHAVEPADNMENPEIAAETTVQPEQMNVIAPAQLPLNLNNLSVATESGIYKQVHSKSDQVVLNLRYTKTIDQE